MPGCKITVLKRTLNADLAQEHVLNKVGPCELFTEGQEFLVAPGLGKPDKFCSWAWDDLYKVVVTLARGGNFADGMFQGWMKDERCMISCCSDGIRPVVFKVERVD